jgi:hypothetical protein
MLSCALPPPGASPRPAFARHRAPRVWPEACRRAPVWRTVAQPGGRPALDLAMWPITGNAKRQVKSGFTTKKDARLGSPTASANSAFGFFEPIAPRQAELEGLNPGVPHRRGSPMTFDPGYGPRANAAEQRACGALPLLSPRRHAHSERVQSSLAFGDRMLAQHEQPVLAHQGPVKPDSPSAPARVWMRKRSP